MDSLIIALAFFVILGILVCRLIITLVIRAEAIDFIGAVIVIDVVFEEFSIVSHEMP